MTGLLTSSVRLLGNRLLLEPIYGAEKIGSLYVTESFNVEQPHQGEVVAAAKEVPFKPGDIVLVRPFVGEPVRDGRYLVYGLSQVVCKVDGRELYPKPDEVMIVPDWSKKYRQPGGLIWLPPSALEHNQPAMFGTIARVGDKVTKVKSGDYVIFDNKGVEASFIDTNYYFLSEEDILAHYHEGLLEEYEKEINSPEYKRRWQNEYQGTFPPPKKP